MVALETGELSEVATNFYGGLSTLDSNATMRAALEPVASGQAADEPLGKAISGSPELRKALDVVLVQSGELPVGKLQRIAIVSRRFSFNPPA
jgi:hypothetical protein